MKKNDELLSLTQCAKYGGVTKAAIYAMIKAGRIKAAKHGSKWKILRSDYDEFKCNKYSRLNRKIEGKPINDFESGYFSISYLVQVFSRELGYKFPMQRFYYLIRKGDISALRKGKTIMISEREAREALDYEANYYRLRHKRIVSV